MEVEHTSQPISDLAAALGPPEAVSFLPVFFEAVTSSGWGTMGVKGLAGEPVFRGGASASSQF